MPQERTLVIADTHLGYAWTQRLRGQLLPLGDEDTAARVAALLIDYPASRVVILGDVVHSAVVAEKLAPPLRDLCERVVTNERELVLVLGNHDRGLAECLRAWRLPARTMSAVALPGFHLVHGDLPLTDVADDATVLSGHEHPSLQLDDGVATRAKVPAFLLAPRAVLLPAFSAWAAGTVARAGGFQGPVAHGFDYRESVACLGSRVLRLPFPLRRRIDP